MKFKEDQTSQKLRGGYYTPQNLADYAARWVLAGDPKSILEPSCGDGVFFTALDNNNCDKSLQIKGFELFDTEAQKSTQRCISLGFSNAEICEGDFLQWANPKVSKQQQLFDGVVGNPPFIRYQFLEEEFQAQTEQIFNTLSLKFTKHTNAWVPFILASLSILNKGGRLGMIIPSEIIHVMHAQSLRTYLGNVCEKLVIIDPQEIWFEGTLQGAVILLAQKKINKTKPSQGVGIKHVRGFDFLNADPETMFEQTPAINGATVVGKWTKAFLTPSELELINRVTENNSVHQFKSIAQVDVGIVTGANKFFLVEQSVVEQYNLQDYASPMFGKSQHCQGIVYDETQHNQNKQNGLPTSFLYIKDKFEDLPESVQSYIKQGEQEKLHTRYKCRIRKPWYKVPSVYSRNMGMLKRAHDTPRLIYNEAQAYTTDTAYRITCDQFDAEKLTYCFLNPLTAIFAELEGRYYGGGVLELVPSEIEKLYIPMPEGLEFDLKALNHKVKNSKISEVLKHQGHEILGLLGYSSNESDTLFNIWEKLKNRRQRK